MGQGACRVAALKEPDQVRRNQNRQENEPNQGQEGAAEDARNEIGDHTLLGAVCCYHDLQTGLKHRLREVPVRFPLGCDGYSGYPQSYLLQPYAVEQLHDRRLDQKLGCNVHVLCEFLPELDAEAGQLTILFKDKGFNQARGD